MPLHDFWTHLFLSLGIRNDDNIATPTR